MTRCPSTRPWHALNIHPLPLLIAIIATTLIPTPSAQLASAGQFSSLTTMGTDSTSSAVAHSLTTTANGTLFLAGTSTPFSLDTEGDFGIALDPGLRHDDIFFAKLATPLNNNFTPSTAAFRLGSAHDDRLHAMLVHDGGDATFLAGRTSGTWRNSSTNKGQDDLFVVKLHTRSTPPTYAWPQPLILGTSATEAVTALAADPANNDVIYATGYTSGSLFSPSIVLNSVLRDAILFAFSAANGSILFQKQFGTEYADYGTGIVVSADSDGPVFVSVVTEPKFGQYALGNFHLYKFTRSLEPLGDVLLRSYSHETVTSFRMHPSLTGTLMVAGYSWLDEENGYDAFVKRVVRPFDGTNIGTSSIDIDDVGQDEFTHRMGSGKKENDFLTAMAVHPSSGRVLVGGYTSGTFSDNAANRGEQAPFIGCIDPTNGSVTAISEVVLTNALARMELAALSLQPGGDGVFYLVNVLDDRNLFSVAVGLYGLPPSWKTPIRVPPSPSVSPPFKGSSPRPTVTEKSGFPIMNVVPGVAGGVAGVAVIIVICFVVMRRRGEDEDATKVPQRRQKELRDREQARQRRERIVTKDDADAGRMAPELV